MPGAAIADNVLSPSQLNALARSLLEDAFPVVLVEGEIGNLARPASGHIYLTLKDARAQRSEEHTSELQSLMRNSYAVFCLKNKTKKVYNLTHKNNTKYK